jgi:hypothetical protein
MRLLGTRARGLLSYCSLWSVLSASSVLSVASAASILSIGSFASILSIGSSNSVLSIGSDRGFLSIGSRRRSRRGAEGGLEDRVAQRSQHPDANPAVEHHETKSVGERGMNDGS